VNGLVPTAVSPLCVLLSPVCSRMLLVLNCADIRGRKVKCLLEITSMHGCASGKRGSSKARQAGLGF